MLKTKKLTAALFMYRAITSQLRAIMVPSALSCCHGDGDVRRRITAESTCLRRMLCRHSSLLLLVLLLLLVVVESLASSRHVLLSGACVITMVVRRHDDSATVVVVVDASSRYCCRSAASLPNSDIAVLKIPRCRKHWT